EHCLDVRLDRQPRADPGALQRLQGRGRAFDQEPGDGMGRPWRPGQLDQPGLYADPDEFAARGRRAAQDLREGDPDGPYGYGRRDGWTGRFPAQPRRLLRHRHRPAGRWRVRVLVRTLNPQEENSALRLDSKAIAVSAEAASR